MTKETFQLLEDYMRPYMTDSVHDIHHVHRVLHAALEIAAAEADVDFDVLIAACLLHDIGRQSEMIDHTLCHAAVGSEMAYHFLLDHNFTQAFAAHVRDCIATHRFRKGAPPRSIEAKILYDADKIDVSGALGIARTLMFKAGLEEPLYRLSPEGRVSDGSEDAEKSFFQEYHHKLQPLYTKFFTARAAEIAQSRRAAAVSYYESLLREVRASHALGCDILQQHLT